MPRDQSDLFGLCYLNTIEKVYFVEKIFISLVR